MCYSLWLIRGLFHVFPGNLFNIILNPWSLFSSHTSLPIAKQIYRNTRYFFFKTILLTPWIHKTTIRSCIWITKWLLLLVYPINLSHSQESDHNPQLIASKPSTSLHIDLILYIIYSLQLHGFSDSLTCQQCCFTSTFALAVPSVSSRKATVKAKYWNPATVFPSTFPLLIPHTI